MKAILILAALAVLAIGPAAALAADEKSRPRIGLVLGGGGAKGAAHVGVLRVLDELRIPIDCIAGTSMGALVGGTYASGMSAEELERQSLAINWSATVGSEGFRDRMPIERKLTASTYTNTLELGLKKGRVMFPAGLVRTQDIEDVIRSLISSARFQRDFDDLPIPFRAVATDMVAGTMVVMDSGDLSVAMRASMAVPGVFSPVVLGEQVLSDGGMTRNLPVDVARELCADVVIAVWLSSPPPTAAELTSALSLASRSMDVMINANESVQIATLTERDVGIEVPMGDITAADFPRAPEAIVLGREAAEAMSDSLSRYSVSDEEYAAWRQSIEQDSVQGVQLAEVRITGLNRVNPEFVKAQLHHLAPGVTVTAEQISEDTDRIYALGDFEKVEYQLSGPVNARILEIAPVEKSWGPNYLRFDLGLATQSTGELQAILRGEHSRAWINSRGGRWTNTIQVGRLSLVSTELYQPLDVPQRFFFMPAARFENSLEDIYQDADRIARYFFRELYGEAIAGMNMGSLARFFGGLRVGWIESELDTGIPRLPEFDEEVDSRLLAGAVYDTRDDIGLPTRGSFVNLSLMSSGNWLGGEQNYDLVEGVFLRAFPWRNNSLSVTVSGGEELAGRLPPNRVFRLGGIRTFPGLRPGELRGDGYWLAGATYLWKLADIQPLFGQAIYAGMRLQAGRMKGRIDGVRDGTLFGLSGSLNGRTPVGPFIISLGFVDNDSWELQFSLGRPVPEGSLLDEVH